MPRHHFQDGSLNVHPGRVDSLAGGKIVAKFRPALDLLFEASEYAGQTSGDRWEFAVEIEQLCELGLSHNDLRWLVRRRLVEHAREVTIEGDNGRQFRPTGDLTFTRRTCFVLTSHGVVAASESCEARSLTALPRLSAIGTAVDDSEATAKPSVPTWDAEKRELWFDGQVVKQFKWHAMNQESVLAAFEEEEWPGRIDDPLPPHFTNGFRLFTGEIHSCRIQPSKGGDRRSKAQRGPLKLGELGITRHQSTRWQLVASVPDRDFDRFIRAKSDLGEEITAASVHRLARELKQSKKRNVAPSSLSNPEMCLARFRVAARQVRDRLPAEHGRKPWGGYRPHR